MVSILLSLLFSLSTSLEAKPNEAIPMQQWTKKAGAQKTPHKEEVFNVADYGVSQRW